MSVELPRGRWISMDPGEDTGWCLWEYDQLVDGGTEKLWTFGDQMFYAILQDRLPAFELEAAKESDPNVALFLEKPIELVVCEDWRIYPWEAKNMSWDQCRTARLIGSITQSCRIAGIPLKLQPAAIKERAMAAGAGELFARPLVENRHQNDSCMHGSYYIGLSRGAKPISKHEAEAAN